MANRGGQPGTRIDGNKLYNKMIEREIDKNRLAKMMGVTTNTINTWLRGKYGLRDNTLDQLTAILNCEVEDLLPDKKEVEEIKETTQEVVKLEAHVSNQELDILKDVIKAQGEQIQSLCNALQSAVDALNEVAGRDTAALSEITIEAVNEDFKLWKQNAVRCANKVVSVNKTFKSTNSAFSEAFRLLRNQYGVVWEQEKKEFFEANGRSPVSTLELEYWIETTKPSHKNLLVAKLDTLCHKDYYGKTRS